MANHILRYKIRFWLCWPGLFAYFAWRPRARVLIHDKSGRILLVKGLWKRWFNDDGWSLPGGGVTRREQPVEGAVRELREELGIKVSSKQLVLLGEATVHERGIRYHAHFFELVLPPDIHLHLQPKEIAEAKWVRVSTLSLASLKPEVRHVLRVWPGGGALLQ